MPNDQPDWTSVVARPQVQLAGSPWAYGATTQTQNFVLSADTSIIGILLPGYLTVTVTTVTGHVSGTVYQTLNPSQVRFPDVFYTLVQSGVDTSVDITITASATGTAYVSSIPDPVAAAQIIQNPAPWQAPNQLPAQLNFANPGNLATATIIAAPSGSQSIWLHTMSWQWTTADSSMHGIFQDSGGTQFLDDGSFVAGTRAYMDFKGARLDPGTSFVFKQFTATAANSTFCFGGVTYSVA